MMRAAALALVLAGCAPLPDHVVGAWDRIFASGAPIAPGTLDRLTFTIEGHATKERGGRIEHGYWSGGDLAQYTLAFPGDVTSWSARKGDCPDGPAPPACLVLRNASAVDWYRGNLALLTAVQSRVARVELTVSDGRDAHNHGTVGLGVGARE